MLDRREFLGGASSTLAAHALGFAEDKPPQMIDAHVHVFRASAEMPYAEGAKPPAEDAPVEQLLDLMKANGVARTVLIQVIHYKWDNRYLGSVLKRYPKLFHGVCRVNPQDPSAPDELSRLTREGFRGVRLSPAGTSEGDWIRGPLMQPLWRRCAELKVPMTLLIPVSRIADIVPLIERNPELDVVIDHMAQCPLGRPEELKQLLDLARFPRVYVKISGLWEVSHQPYPYVDAQEQVRRVLDRFGAERLMWATNWPVSLKQLSYSQAVALYREHMPFLSASDRAQILYKTVQRVWPFGSSQT